MKKIDRITKTPFFKVLVIFFVLFIVVKTLDYFGSSDSPPEYPDYEMIDLNMAVDLEQVYRGRMDDNTKEVLFLQTGLGEEGIEDLCSRCETTAELLVSLEKYQKQLFFGNEETLMIDLEEGDILVSLSQRFCFYPHGHAAMVLDGEKQEILEAKSYAAGSCISSMKRWLKNCSFVVLRLKESVIEEYARQNGIHLAVAATEFAKENLVGLKYSLFKDLRPLSDTIPEYTQCAHLVWYAYYACGLDIDENRGLIIKPKDFLTSDALEVVQVYGINPEEILEMRNE